MKPLFFPVCILGLGSMIAVRSEEPDETRKGQLPSIREIMQESHQCRTAYVRQIREEMNKDDINWSLVETKSKQLITTGKMLALNTPPKGTITGWENKTTIYTANAVLMSDAAEKKNKDDVNYHVKKLVAMCATCHREHR